MRDLQKTLVSFPALLTLCAASVLLLPAALPAQEEGESPTPAADTAAPGLAELLADMRVRAGRVRRFALEMTTMATLPNGLTLQSRGTMRVLSGTHFMVENEATYSDGLQGVTRSVRTPDGIRVLEEDPTVGRVFFQIDKGLMEQLDRAQKTLTKNGRDGGSVIGAGLADGLGPHGHQVLAELAARYDLKVVGEDRSQGVAAYRIAGDLRGGAEAGIDLPISDRVEAWVRVRDRALIRMTQSREGKPVLDITVTKLQIDPPMDPREFILKLEGVEPVDVRDFPPAWQQIQSVLAEAKSLRQAAPAEGEGDGEEGKAKESESGGKSGGG